VVQAAFARVAALLKQAGINPDTRLIDIDAGASMLVDDLTVHALI
jgi:hypothetical protein